MDKNYKGLVITEVTSVNLHLIKILYHRTIPVADRTAYGRNMYILFDAQKKAI